MSSYVEYAGIIAKLQSIPGNDQQWRYILSTGNMGPGDWHTLDGEHNEKTATEALHEIMESAASDFAKQLRATGEEAIKGANDIYDILEGISINRMNQRIAKQREEAKARE